MYEDFVDYVRPYDVKEQCLFLYEIFFLEVIHIEPHKYPYYVQGY